MNRIKWKWFSHDLAWSDILKVDKIENKSFDSVLLQKQQQQQQQRPKNITFMSKETHTESMLCLQQVCGARSSAFNALTVRTIEDQQIYMIKMAL